MSAPELRSPLDGHAKPGRHGASGGSPISIRERRVAIVQLFARKGREADLAAAIQRALGVALPDRGRSVGNDQFAAMWMQPGAWTIVAPRADEGGLARAIKSAVGDTGSVVDQSHGKLVLRVGGAAARELLAKTCRVDLHPREFAPGHVASTVMAQIGCMIRQVDATPTYDLLVPANFALAFFEGLIEMAAGYGCEIVRE